MTLTQLHTPGKNKTCQLVTLGCKVNQYETQLVKEALEKNGYREAEETETADLCVVNTCTVTATGDSKGRKLIRNLAKKNPGTKILVMGCYATRDPKTVSKLPGVFEVVTDKRELPDILERHGIVDMPTGISEFEGRKRAYVKVQDGCILRCTYCIIPSVRPGLQSRSPEDIEAEVRRLVENGFKEIVLTGIHVGHFGVDTTRGKSGKPPFRLWHLFRKLDQIPGDWRMRLSSVETAEINDDFISAAADCEHLCPQFHPSLQSGSDTVLRRMKRRYHVSRFLEKLQRMRERLNHPSFTTDVIVGFPGETDEEFAETMQACEEAAFMKIHIFPFSARKGTPAATYENQVSPEIRQERCTQLSDLERSLAQKFYHTLIDRKLEVMIERECEERPGWVRGTDRWYAPVICQGTKADLGKFVYAQGRKDHLEYLEADRTSP
ncbi:MAG: tRNA (N(6)-L-threonylcarbamoyladenosine(37)-C(2))-methylthiotransferase MtaB [Planctomycetaceae bacterium]|nr:tRNA (N(6)-L-threonylcarbamoyladenosine(37)-C(2))-methylthiotransferase MtaB [Planctomycetaceae bacterium]MCA9018818.1 tRNA (N(6)-L-threonylcarbamoyladenosine(37)-C(2))-methylthiotransferase MtaB [Planctomycetaceae bacterium]